MKRPEGRKFAMKSHFCKASGALSSRRDETHDQKRKHYSLGKASTRRGERAVVQKRKRDSAGDERGQQGPGCQDCSSYRWTSSGGEGRERVGGVFGREPKPWVESSKKQGENLGATPCGKRSHWMRGHLGGGRERMEPSEK